MTAGEIMLMQKAELSEATPPVYTEWIGKQILEAIS